MSTEDDSDGMTAQAELDRELLINALMEFSGRSRGEIERFLECKSDDELVDIRNSQRVKLIIDRLKSEAPS